MLHDGRRVPHRVGRTRSTRAFTLVEIVVGLSIATLTLSMAYSLQLGATRSSTRSGEHAEALRSVMIAMESVRRDLEQMLYQCPQRDLVLIAHPELGENRGVSLRVPDVRNGAGLWGALHVPVTYSLRHVEGPSQAYRLVRTETKTGRETVLKSCLLRDMVVHFVPLKTTRSQGLSPYRAYLEVTMVGLGSVTGAVTYTSSMMVPLALMSPAGAYTVRLPSGSP